MSGNHEELTEAQQEVLRLKQELARVTEERDIPKKAATYFTKASEWERFTRTFYMSLPEREDR